MSRFLFQVPDGSTEPDWNYFGEEDGLHKFKIQIKPELMTKKRLPTIVMQTGSKFFRLVRMERIAGLPTQPPKLPFFVWAKRLQ